MGLDETLLVVASSVAKLVIAGGSCAYTYRSLKRSHQIEEQTLKALSGVNKQLLIPLFIFTKCAQGVTAEKLAEFAFVPVLVCSFMLTGLLAGVLAARLTRAPPAAMRIAKACCAFSNVLGLPLPLVQSIVAGLAAYASDEEAQSRCISYLFLANIASSTCMWSCAPRMLAPASATPPMLEESKVPSEAAVAPAATAVPVSRVVDVGGEAVARTHLAAARRVARAAMASLNRPTCASLLGVVFGATPPLRQLVVERHAPLRFVLDALELLGAAAIPLIIFVLGGTLSNGPAAGSSADMPPRTIAAIIAAKLLLVPLANMLVVLAALRVGLLPAADPLLPLCLLVIGASPTAMNLSTISSLAGFGQREVATLLFWQYVLATITMSIFATVGLVLFMG